MTPICACCLEAPEFTITDYAGRPWRFEQHRIFGPVVLRRDGQPKERQPGSRSSFWPAWQKWRDKQKACPA